MGCMRVPQACVPFANFENLSINARATLVCGFAAIGSPNFRGFFVSDTENPSPARQVRNYLPFRV